MIILPSIQIPEKDSKMEYSKAKGTVSFDDIALRFQHRKSKRHFFP